MAKRTTNGGTVAQSRNRNGSEDAAGGGNGNARPALSVNLAIMAAGGRRLPLFPGFQVLQQKWHIRQLQNIPACNPSGGIWK
jgi:hypothetical protein